MFNKQMSKLYDIHMLQPTVEQGKAAGVCGRLPTCIIYSGRVTASKPTSSPSNIHIIFLDETNISIEKILMIGT